MVDRCSRDAPAGKAVIRGTTSFPVTDPDQNALHCLYGGSYGDFEPDSYSHLRLQFSGSARVCAMEIDNVSASNPNRRRKESV
jgi:hypothetical protein